MNIAQEIGIAANSHVGGCIPIPDIPHTCIRYWMSIQYSWALPNPQHCVKTIQIHGVLYIVLHEPVH